MLVTDRGPENKSLAVDHWASEFGFIATTLKRRAADLKGVGERGFSLVQERGIYGEAGALSPAEGKRDLKRSTPRDLLPALRQRVIETIVEINHSEMPHEYIDDRSRAAGCGRMTRQQYYDWGVGMYGTPPSMDDVADLSRKLLPSQLCPVTRKGFSLNGVYYLPTVTSMETYFQRNTSGPPKQKRLSHDPSNVSDAWLWPDKSQRSESLEPLVLRPQDASYAGLSVAESKALHRLEKASNPAIDQEVLSSQVTSKLRRDMISAQELSDRRKDKRDLKLIASSVPEPVETLLPPVTPPRPAMPRLSIAQLIDRQKRSGTS